jgi:predicted Zn-dependent peptidase
MKFGAAAAALLLAASCFSAHAAGAAESAQQKGALPRGGSYVLDPDPTIASAAVGLWFRAPGAGYDNATPGISRLAATAAAVAPLAGGKSLYALVHSVGGQLNVNVYPDIVAIGAVIPSPAARRVVAAITAAYFAPAIDDASVKTAQRDAAVLAVQQHYSADLTLRDLLFKQLFSGGPAHYPPLPDSVVAISRIGAPAVEAFAKRAFRSGNAILTLAGNVDATSISAVTDGGGNAQMDPPIDSSLAGTFGPTRVSGAASGVGMAWVGPPIADEKAATAMDFIADYLFRDDTGTVSQALGVAQAYAAGQFITLHDPGIMLVTVGGQDAKTAQKQVLDALVKLETPLDPQAFEAAREAFLYHLASETQTPQERADNLGWYAAEGNLDYAPGDAGGAYERTARTLDPQYVAGIVRRYLANPVTVDLVPTAPAKESSS